MIRLRKSKLATGVVAAAVFAVALSGPAQAEEPNAQASGASTMSAAANNSTQTRTTDSKLMVPIWITLGSRIKLPYARLAVRDGSGKVVSRLRANANGIALIDKSELPAKYSIAVTGGMSWRKAGKPALRTNEVLGSRFTTILVSPVTTIASLVAKRKKISYNKALNRTKNAISIPDWATPYQFSTTPNVFDGHAFGEWAFKRGGQAKALKTMAKRIAAGKSVPDFSPMNPPKKKKPRSAVTWLGQTAMTSILKGSVSFGTQAFLGDAFGLNDPTADELSSIEATLKQISNQLTTIEGQLDYLTALMQETSMETLYSGMSIVAGNVTDNWPVYDAALQLDPTTTPDYQATILGYANTFYEDFSPYMGQFNLLFNTSTSKGLLYNLYSYNTAPWWNQNDVATIQAQIDAYGTMQAQAVAMLNEAWNYRGPGAQYAETTTYVNSYNQSTYGPQNDNIYKSMPTSIDAGTIVIPSTQMMYKAFPTTVDQVYGMTYKTNDEPSCSSMGSQQNGQSYPTKQTSTSTWNSYWTSAVPSGWTVQSNSAFSLFNMSRTYSVTQNNQTTTSTIWSVPSFAAGVPGAFAMVTTGEYPRAGFTYYSDGYQAGTVFNQYMWCYSSAVSLANSNSWLINFVTNKDGTNVPAGTEAGWIWDPVPVGVLGAQQGSFQYVSP